jgi:hydrogenase nickel incorporation protein HypA/HybF
MHELSLAVNIISNLESSFKADELNQISRIFLKVGSRHAIQIDMLKFAFENSIKDTTLKASTLDIEIVNAEGDCPKCGKVVVFDQFFVCNNCGSFLTNIRGGDQILIENVELKDDIRISPQ